MYNLRMLLKRVLVLTTLLILAATAARAQEAGPGYWDQSPLPQQGLATHYAPGVMEYVYNYRLEQGDIAGCVECVGTVAMLRAGDIGRKVWLKPPAGDPVGPFLVIDCARRQDIQQLLDRNWVVDVSYEVGRFWGMSRPMADVLVFEDPADGGSASPPSGLPTRFYIEPARVVISPPSTTPRPLPAGTDDGVVTPWPTRLPSPLPGVVMNTPEPPRAAGPARVVETLTPAPPTRTPGPPPLTPVITTPTSQPAIVSTSTLIPVDESDGGAAHTTATPGLPATAEPEVSLGGAGGVLLASSDGALFIPPPAASAPTRTLRTPQPHASSVFIVATPVPATTPVAEDSFWERVLRGIRDLLG